jgi:hypothetical protein
MGYTHYWYRPTIIPDVLFDAIRRDFGKVILPLSDAGIEIAGGLGEGPPKITDDEIVFNGVDECGHPQSDELVIPYPSEHAQGIGPSATAVDGSFYGLGVTVKHRCCNGRCSFETFRLERRKILRSNEAPDENGLHCEYVKTAFRPYDIAVTCILLIAKRHLRGQFVIHSNGADAQWSDAKRICQTALGYGDWFGIMEQRIEENWSGAAGSTESREVILRILEEIEPSKLA